jgi:hypothetical protein
VFWLNDEQDGNEFERHLPTDFERVDDRRVISGIVHVLKSGVAGAIARPLVLASVPPRARLSDNQRHRQSSAELSPPRSFCAGWGAPH